MSTRTWKNKVIEANPDWPRDVTQHAAFTFSNGRKVTQTLRPGERYPWAKDMDPPAGGDGGSETP